MMSRTVGWLIVVSVVLLALPAWAKVDLRGAVWATYWAQQAGSDISAQVASGGRWVDARVQPTRLYRGAVPTASPKTFLLAENASGNGLQAHPGANNGFLLQADCAVLDNLKVVGSLRVNNPANAFVIRNAYADYTVNDAFKLRLGRQLVPFGREQSVRPTVGREEVFISSYAQQARGALNNTYDVGVQVYGKLLENALTYRVFAGNGAINTVADSASLVANSQGVPDIDDAKLLGGALNWQPFAGAFIEGSYFTGDFTNTNVSGGRSRYSAYDVNAGYDIANQVLVSAEYATTRHDGLLLESDAGAVGAPAVRTNYLAAKVNEFIVKAVYHGRPDWQFGVRYSVIDPKSFEAELRAGFSREAKFSAGVAYAFAGKATLKAEYSRLITDLDYYSHYDAAAVNGQYRLNPSADPADDIFALQLGLQF